MGRMLFDEDAATRIEAVCRIDAVRRRRPVHRFL
jgi:hypothetical protein